VLDQTAEPLEVIVVDDGSTDETSEVVASFGDRVRYLRQHNQGPGAARNRGLELAQGDYIAFCDGDDCYRPHSIERRAAVLDRYPEVGLVFGDLELFFEPSGVRWRSLTATEFKAGFRRLPRRALEADVSVLEGDVLSTLLVDRFVTMPTAMVRRSCLERWGAFDEGLRMQEDIDLWLRLAERERCAYIDQQLADCRQHDSNLSTRSLLRATTQIQLIHKLMTSAGPTWRSRGRLLRQQLGIYLFDLGYVRFKAEEYAAARRAFAQGLACRPHDWRLWAYAAAACLPAAVREAAKGWRRRVLRQDRAEGRAASGACAVATSPKSTASARRARGRR